MKLSLITKITLAIVLMVTAMSVISIYLFSRANHEVAQTLQQTQKSYIIQRIEQEKKQQISEQIRYIRMYAQAIKGAVAQSLFQLDREVLQTILRTFAQLRSVWAVYIDDRIVNTPYMGIIREGKNLRFTTIMPEEMNVKNLLTFPLKVEEKLIGEMRVYYDMHSITESLNAQQQKDLKALANQSKMIRDRMQRYLWQQVGMFVVFMAVMMVLIFYLLHRLVNRPLKTLQGNMKGFFAFFKDTRYRFAPVPIQTGDEFEEISSEINRNIETVLDLHHDLEETQMETLFTIGTIAEAHSNETGRHVQRVAEYSQLLGRHYGLSEEEVKILGYASAVHDIGKLTVSDNILNKRGKLTKEEFEQIKQHTVHGYNMLRHSNRSLLKAAATIAYEHHEKYDGTGYPRGLKGEDIHIYGRIVALADVFDALGSDRVYKEAWDDERIFALLRKERGRHFDPKLVDIFFGHLDTFLAIRKRLRENLSSSTAE